MGGGAWWATVHGVPKSWTRLSDITSTLKKTAFIHCVLTQPLCLFLFFFFIWCFILNAQHKFLGIFSFMDLCEGNVCICIFYPTVMIQIFNLKGKFPECFSHHFSVLQRIKASTLYDLILFPLLVLCCRQISFKRPSFLPSCLEL